MRPLLIAIASASLFAQLVASGCAVGPAYRKPATTLENFHSAGATYIGQGAPRFFSYNPELPDPAFAKLIILTPGARARDRLKWRLRERIAEGLAPEARVRVSQLIFGPYPRYLVNFRVMGPDPERLRTIANEVEAVMRANPHTRQVNEDWGERVPAVHFVLDQNRLKLMGLTSSDASEQLQFLLTGVPVTQVREDIRTVEVVARSAGPGAARPGTTR
jgi:multidrug efflux pump subunit AcrB